MQRISELYFGNAVHLQILASLARSIELMSRNLEICKYRSYYNQAVQPALYQIKVSMGHFKAVALELVGDDFFASCRRADSGTEVPARSPSSSAERAARVANVEAVKGADGRHSEHHPRNGFSVSPVPNRGFGPQPFKKLAALRWRRRPLGPCPLAKLARAPCLARAPRA